MDVYKCLKIIRDFFIYNIHNLYQPLSCAWNMILSSKEKINCTEVLKIVCIFACLRLIHIFLALESVNVKKVFKIPGGKMYNITLFIYRIYNIYTKIST